MYLHDQRHAIAQMQTARSLVFMPAISHQAQGAVTHHVVSAAPHTLKIMFAIKQTILKGQGITWHCVQTRHIQIPAVRRLVVSQNCSHTNACANISQASYTKGDIVYVNNQWLCCGADSKGSPACSNPTTEVVNGIPNPNTLQAVLAGVTVSSSSSAASATSIRTSTQSISSSSSTSTVGPSSNSSSSSSNQAATTSSGLSTGAKAGIGAGVGILVIIAFLAAFFLLRRSNSRRHQRDHPFQSDEKVNDSTTAPHKYHSEMDSAVLPVYHERDTKLQQSYPAELMSPPPQSQQRVHEMGWGQSGIELLPSAWAWTGKALVKLLTQKVFDIRFGPDVLRGLVDYASRFHLQNSTFKFRGLPPLRWNGSGTIHYLPNFWLRFVFWILKTTSYDGFKRCANI